MKKGNNAKKKKVIELKPYSTKYPIEVLKPDVVLYGGREIKGPEPLIID